MAQTNWLTTNRQPDKRTNKQPDKRTNKRTYRREGCFWQAPQVHIHPFFGVRVALWSPLKAVQWLCQTQTTIWMNRHNDTELYDVLLITVPNLQIQSLNNFCSLRKWKSGNTSVVGTITSSWIKTNEVINSKDHNMTMIWLWRQYNYIETVTYWVIYWYLT